MSTCRYFSGKMSKSLLVKDSYAQYIGQGKKNDTLNTFMDV